MKEKFTPEEQELLQLGRLYKQMRSEQETTGQRSNFDLTEEERKMIRERKVYKRTTQDNINLYYQKLLNCLEELDAAFEGGYEDMEMEELHGHMIREIRRIEDILEIPHTHIELDPLLEDLFTNEILKRVNEDPALKDVQAPPELLKKVFHQIKEYEKQK